MGYMGEGGVKNLKKEVTYFVNGPLIQSTLDPFIQKSLRGKKNNNKMFQKKPL